MKFDGSQDGFESPSVIPTFHEEYFRHGLIHAAQQVEQGEIADWDVEEIKALGRELLAEHQREH